MFLPLLLLACGPAFEPLTYEGACDTESAHLYRIVAPEPGLYRVEVDTLAAESAFDPDLFLYTVDAWSEDADAVMASDLLNYVDDAFPCTFPPPQFECPQLAYDVEGTDDLLVVVGIRGSCAGTEAAYQLTVERLTEDVEVVFVGETSIDRFLSE